MFHSNPPALYFLYINQSNYYKLVKKMAILLKLWSILS